MKSSEQYLWLEVEADGNGVKGGERAGAAARSHAARYHHKIKRSETVVQFSDSRNRTTLLVAPHKANASYQGRWPDKSRQNCFLASNSKSTSTERRIDHQASLKDQGPSKLAQVSFRKPRGGPSTQQNLTGRSVSGNWMSQIKTFHNLPVCLDQYSAIMLRYGDLLTETVFTVWVPELYPHKSSTLQKQEYFEQVTTDSLLLSVTLIAAFARAVFAIEGTKDSGTLEPNKMALVESYRLKYKGITIQMLINGLELSTYSTLQIFTTVTTMAGCEFLVNNPKEGRLHLRASAKVASSNGGFGTIPALLLEIFLLGEGLLASLSGSRPVVPHDELAPAVYALLPKVPEFVEKSSAQFDKLLRKSWPVEESCSFMEVMAELYAATEIINAYTNQRIDDQLRETIVLRIFLIGFRLSWSLEASLPTHSGVGWHNVAKECVRLSGLLLIHTTHLKGTPKQHLYERMAADLMRRLQQLSDASESLQTVAWMEIWASFLGAFVSTGTERETFYMNRIYRAAELLALKNWVEIRAWLKRFPYVDKEFDKPFEKIWSRARR